MTAKRRDENPDIHASNNTANVMRLLQPAVLRLINDDFVDLFIIMMDAGWMMRVKRVFSATCVVGGGVGRTAET